VKTILLKLSILLLICLKSTAQLRIISGKVVDEEFRPMPKVAIWNSDTIKLCETNIDGTFKIDISTGIKHIIIGAVAVEWKDIYLSDSCNYFEFILLNRGTYDFMSPAKVDRRRLRQFNQLSDLHEKAYQHGIFINSNPCYQEKFVSVRQRLKEIHRARSKF